jgi:hypothetical protein
MAAGGGDIYKQSAKLFAANLLSVLKAGSNVRLQASQDGAEITVSAAAPAAGGGGDEWAAEEIKQP